MTAYGKIIRSEEVDTIKLILLNEIDVMLLIVNYTIRCDFNLISLGKLRETGILYHNNPKSMILKKTKNVIGLV